MKSFFKENKGISAGLISLLVLVIFILLPGLADGFYRKFLLQAVRVIADYSLALIPLSLIYLLIMGLPLILYFYFRKIKNGFKGFILRLFNFFGWIVAAFFFLWGYNYTCSDMLPLNKDLTMTEGELYNFGILISERVNEQRKTGNGLQFEYSDSEIRESVEAYCSVQSLPVIGRVQCKEIGMGGVLRKVGISGIYMPFALESYCDATLPDVVKAFVKAHEMSHGYGITNEGEADYFAYKSLKEKSDSPDLAYAAELELLRSVRSQLYLINDSLRKDLDSTLSPEVMQDVVAIREDARKYKEFIPGLGSGVNDHYLKAMGIRDGVLSYDRFVQLVWQNP